MLLVLALAFPLAASDITGAWVGKVEVADPGNGEKISTTVKAQLEQKGGAVSGKIGREHDQDQDLEQIRNAKLNGNTLTFEVQPEEATAPMVFTLTLVNEDRIEGGMKGQVDTGNITGTVLLTRVKQQAEK
jgi:hypothetical protein